MIAALYVERGGSYFDLPEVDPWDEARDARQYQGPHPIVGHPPCQRWGKLWAGQPLYIKRTGIRKKKGDDDGCFEACLTAAREYGGVIEHPWGSHAWPHFGLNTPPREGGWITADFHGGWTCCVEQGRYGHYARKPTLLLVYGVHPDDLPNLDFGIGEPRLDPAIVARMGLKRAKRLGEVGGKGGGTDSTPRIGTPVPFRELLLSIARQVLPPPPPSKRPPPMLEEKDVPQGMKAYGPDHPDYPNEPADWDRGPYLCRDGQMYHMRGYGWQHGMYCYSSTADYDRIAYTPQVTP